MKASENPFRSAEIAKLRYRITEPALQSMAAELIESERPCAIIGPQGTGKTTLLEDLAAQIKISGHPLAWHRLTHTSTKLERKAVLDRLFQSSANLIHMLDGGEVLSPFQWWQIRQRGRSGLRLITTLHRNRGLRILHETTPDWELTHEFVKDLYQDDHLSQVAQSAFQSNQGNVREVFRACYWACARK